MSYSLDQLLSIPLSADLKFSLVELKNIAFFAQLSRVFVTAALGSQSSSVASASQLVKQSSSIGEGSEEIKKVEGKPSAVEVIDSLMNESQAGAEIMLNTDFKGLLIKLLELISQMVISQNIVIENKFIVENSLNLVISIIINQPELLKTLIDFQSEFVPQF